ncbi:DNA-binding transcriptional LysR family regulator [Duganella sp. 1411]|uniref:LysR family transcriptional regulator n=1 Tax=Duganella sp. 1411 TaxID=2806572 RepID=UPI001AE96991|nr:LysR family transcriptional regulator [Duganella sp. 1411]MBP1204973.1 DNA-binding transcriptional LysR family regulator [Duganella sp. 1411]
MDLSELRVFCRVAELASFTKAAEQLNMAKGRVSTVVRALEAEVGGRLLQRTTRSVRLTPDGEVFLLRCKELLTEADQLQGMFRPATGEMRGRVRIDMPSMFAQELVMPHLPALLSAHPLLDLGISTNDRRVDMVREGFDALIRIGPLPDSDLVARPLGMMAMCNLASPAYLRQHGTPLSLADLAHHRIVHYAANLRSEAAALRCEVDGALRAVPMRSALSVNSSTYMQAACVNGLGIMQAALPTNRRLIDSGDLVEVLPGFRPPPTQVSLVVPHRRHLAPRVEMVFNWLVRIIRPSMLEPPAPGAG